MTDPTFFSGFDGAALAVRRMGAGRPLLLLHGLFSNAELNWVRYGHAAALADAGFDVIMPDFRAHGASAAPHAAEAYPTDVLARDIEALLPQLGLTDFDLGGYSLGARTAVRLVARGMRPRRLALAGMGLEGVVGASGRQAFFLNAIAGMGGHAQGSGAWFVEQFIKTMRIDTVAAAHVIRSFADTPRSALAAVAMPTAVICGADDRDNGSAPALAAALPDARYIEVPGNHMSAVIDPALGRAMADFLAEA